MHRPLAILSLLILSLALVSAATVTGRVVDTHHHPLAGVKVTLCVSYQQDRQTKNFTVVTGADGRYKLPMTAPHEVFLSLLEKAGYRQRFTKNLITNNSKDTLADAVMVPYNAVVHGKVCDAAGKPVKGATVVSVEVGLFYRAVTDSAGAFTLTHQPLDVQHLIAATPTGGGLATGTENTKSVLITCSPARIAKPHDIPLALALLDADSKLPKEKRRFNRAETIHQIANIDLALAVRLSTTGDEPVPDGLRAYLLARQAEQNPVKVDEILAQLNTLHNPACKLYAAVEMGIAVVQTDPALAGRLYLTAKPIYDRSSHGRDAAMTIPGLGSFDDISLRTITLAGLLRKTADLNTMLAHLHIAAKLAEKENAVFFTPLAAAAGRVSPEFVFKVYNGIFTAQSKNIFKSEYLAAAVTSMAQHDPQAALRLMKMIEGKKYKFKVMYNVLPIIEALGKKDPAAVLALAKARNADMNVDMRTAALLEAAAFQPKAAARAIIQDILSVVRNQTMVTIAKVNMIDPELGQELYVKYYKQGREVKNYANGDLIWYSMQNAYLISSIDPVEARLMIETAYARALGNQFGGQFELGDCALAMCTIDLDRALAMSDVSKAHDVDFAPQRLMHYILMSHEERASGSNFYSD